MKNFIKTFLASSLLLLGVISESLILVLILITLIIIGYFVFDKMEEDFKDEVKDWVNDKIDELMEISFIPIFLGYILPPIFLFLFMWNFNKGIYLIENHPEVKCSFLNKESKFTHLYGCSDNKEYIGYKIIKQGDLK